jgi:hypothetical protein
MEDHMGAGFVWEVNGALVSSEFYLGKHVEVFDAELFAIYRVLRDFWANKFWRDEPPTAVTIFSDVQAALDRLRTDSPGPGQRFARLINAEAAELRKWGIPVEFRWVPGYSDIPENEAADAATKRATRHRCTAGAPVQCDSTMCLTPSWASLAHVSCLATEAQADITKHWISQRLVGSKSYHLRKKWGLRKDLQTIPKRRAAVFLQLASGHALIGTHLVCIKKKESDRCWWCESGRRQTHGHLFGECRRWQCEFAELRKEVERIMGKTRRLRERLKVVHLFNDDWLTKVILEFLAATEVGRRYE